MTAVKHAKSKVKSKNNKKKSKNNKKKSTNNKVNPTKSKVNPTKSKVKSKNNKKESTKSKVNPTNNKVKSKNNKKESTKSKVNPTTNNLKSTNNNKQPEVFYYKTKGGYYYKQTQNGGSLRVSEAEYIGGAGGLRRLAAAARNKLGMNKKTNQPRDNTSVVTTGVKSDVTTGVKSDVTPNVTTVYQNENEYIVPPTWDLWKAPIPNQPQTDPYHSGLGPSLDRRSSVTPIDNMNRRVLPGASSAVSQGKVTPRTAKKYGEQNKAMMRTRTPSRPQPQPYGRRVISNVI